MTMEMTISPINRNTLSEMHEILCLSAGYQISIENELQYFDPKNSSGWLVAKNRDNRNLAFIRHFKQNIDWSLAEFYVDFNLKNRRDLAQSLITKFKKEAQFPSGHRLRFDILKFDSELNNLVISSGYSQKVQLFRHFEMSVNSTIKLEHLNSESINVQEVTETLLHLNPVTESEVQGWINNGQIRTVVDKSRVVSAAQVFVHANSIEINRIATHPQYLRQGNAERLIHMIRSEAAYTGQNRITLKVEDIRNSAIALYKKSGFIEVEDKSQFWHSSWH